MKKILCFGDSNTWGYDPVNKCRYAHDIRWTGQLQNKFPFDEVRIIEDGLNGRTTVWPDHVEGNKSGLEHIRTSLESQSPLFGIILSLGGNDLKKRFSGTASDAALGILRIIQSIKSYVYPPGCTCPEIIVVSPPSIYSLDEYKDMFVENVEEVSTQFTRYYSKIAEQEGCLFFDAGKFVKPSIPDGLHLNEEGHKKLAEELFGFIKEHWL